MKDELFVLDAEEGQIHEIDLDKNYLVILTFPPDADVRQADETCTHLAALLADWAADDYPNKFLVVGFRGGVEVTLHKHEHAHEGRPLVPQTR